ncbi:acyl-CoA dehydrogenase family protein [Terribacillus saccharophilus]|uniref:Dibenzothiophene monooxygenase n=1 Tax=Terribacillus saccharophilus TaxID=361277 RepID=A0ABX4GYF6_9BACI|nr:acyl-CoA dehydrogenase family protein [Terribacillus saccharophilus]PAD35794.1 monooxygenase [Terribacillus saccharophilus]PAD96335.1 monooxygenase [Terribacillus saccharophilus]PAD99910.1 monooxygenase [Terribacillus saccharophilus]
METIIANDATQYVKIAATLAQEFSKDAAERDKAGGTAKVQRDALRESGLLNLIIPKEYGGEGQPWSIVLKIARELAKTDAALGHLYGYHAFQTVLPHIAGTAKQKEYFYTQSAKNNWFWGNSSNPIEPSLIGRRQGDSFTLNGHNTFSTGAKDSDRLAITWYDNAEKTTFYLGIIPSSRQGVTINTDWDGMGQRQTDSGSVTFENVVVEADEVIDFTESKGTPFATFDAILSQIVLANVFVGSAEGALEEAKKYTIEKSRPWYLTNYEEAIDDPFIQRSYGDLWIDVQAAVQLVEKAGEKVDEAWAKDRSLTEEERGETALFTGAANAFGTKVALHVTSEIFQVMGARSATRKNNFDRFWRNVRTHSLHNPIEYKRKNIGRWMLTGEYPTPTVYS